MIRGLYTAGAGMMLQMSRQDVVANNVANVNTCGFKKSVTVSKAFPEMLISRLGENKETVNGEIKKESPVVIGRLGTGASVSAVYSDFAVGNIKQTENPLDLTISQEGFFAVETPEGERYTRNGEFKINNEGLLTTNLGYPVLDVNDEYISIEGDFSVDSQGNIMVDDEFNSRLKIVVFENPQLLDRIGDSLFNADQDFVQIENPEVLQGYIEESNVNAVSEMVTLISVVRAYESLQKIVQAEDETMQVAIDQVGSVS